MARPSDVRLLTTHYPRLQGLRLVPLGAVFLASAAWRLGWIDLPGGFARARWWFVLALAAAVGASFLMKAAYERRFGRVDLAVWDSGVVGWMILSGAFLIVLAVQDAYQWPLPIPLWFIAG